MNQLGIACAWQAIFEAFRRWIFYTRHLRIADTPIMREAFVQTNEWHWPDVCNEALTTLQRFPNHVDQPLSLRRVV